MKWSEAKRELRTKEKGELVQFLKRLFDLNSENRAFFTANLTECNDNSLEYYKREIADSVNPGIDAPVDLKRGRKAIASFKKVSPDDLWGRVDLMTYFVEQGADFTLTYGDIDGPFYESMCRMVNSILDIVDQLPSIEFSHFVQRFQKLDAKTANQLGWGFSDCITDATSELQCRLGQ